jgi:hypothetical protein
VDPEDPWQATDAAQRRGGQQLYKYNYLNGEKHGRQEYKKYYLDGTEVSQETYQKYIQEVAPEIQELLTLENVVSQV